MHVLTAETDNDPVEVYQFFQARHLAAAGERGEFRFASKRIELRSGRGHLRCSGANRWRLQFGMQLQASRVAIRRPPMWRKSISSFLRLFESLILASAVTAEFTTGVIDGYVNY